MASVHWFGILSLLVTGCSRCEAQSSESQTSARPTASSPRASVEEATEESVNAFAKASNAFAADLYGKWGTGSANLVFSPVSLAVALTTIWMGARGETAAQMANALHLPDSTKETHAAASTLIRSWNEPSDPRLEVHVANRLFVDKRTKLEADFSKISKQYYGITVELLDLGDQPDSARVAINDWARNATKQRIVELIPEGGIGRLTALVLTNAVYFHGRWEHRFDGEATVHRPFYLASGKAVQVPTMYREAEFRHGRVAGAQVIEMRYDGGHMSMILVLPNNRDGLLSLESTLSVAFLRSMSEGLRKEQVKIFLPRFRLAPTQPIRAKSVLESLGMDLSFGDFSGIGRGTGALVVDEVYHKAFIEVDEAGTEAAAATAVVVHTPAAASAPPRVPEFRADHPFLFFIRDTNSGAIMFMGRLQDPRGA